MPQTVIVDENAGPGIPDVEVLDKLLRPEMILLTGDRTLHMPAFFNAPNLSRRTRFSRRI